MNTTNPLSISEKTLIPGQEWILDSSGWNFFRVRQGSGYLFSGTALQEVNDTDIFAVSYSNSTSVRASQLTPLHLLYFSLSPSLLTGLFSPLERAYFENTKNSVIYFPSSHPSAQEFARLETLEREASASLMVRCQILQVVVAMMGTALNQANTETSVPSSCRDRFQIIVRKFSEGEMQQWSLDKMAQFCGCSTRHFSRLFIEHFGYSYKTKQIELRLQKATQLLRETDAKVIDVALESGFQHLSLFNTTFKQNLGMTPREWRKNPEKKFSFKKTTKLLSVLSSKNVKLNSVWKDTITSRTLEAVG
jgi:AraC-like DNA-binding protein